MDGWVETWKSLLWNTWLERGTSGTSLAVPGGRAPILPAQSIGKLRHSDGFLCEGWQGKGLWDDGLALGLTAWAPHPRPLQHQQT